MTVIPRPAAKLEQSLVAQLAQGAQHRVGVDPEHGCQILGWWQTLAGLRLALGDGTADLGCDLLVQLRGRVAIDPDIPHGASNHIVNR